MKKESKAELQELFHLIYIILISVFCVLLAAVSYITRWSIGAVIGCLTAIVFCWIIHFIHMGSDRFRVYCYTLVALIGTFYYGIHPDSLTDVPSILVLVIILLAVSQNLVLIYITAASYFVLIFYHIVISRYLITDINILTLSRIVLGFICIFTAVILSNYFIDYLKRSDRENEMTEKELYNAKKENELFLANLSHELRTPINAVTGLSKIINKDDLPDDIKEPLCSIQDAGQHLYEQVSDIMDYSELITGRLIVSEEIYEPISVMNDSVSIIKQKMKNNNLDVAIDIDHEIPHLLQGDSYKVKKIIVELLDNAIKYTESGGVYLYLSSRKETYGINLNIDVWDTGIGMDAMQLKKYNKRNQNNQEASRKSKGLGLGLSIIHGMVSSMKGFMTIHSDSGEGTHVHVTLPQRVIDKTPCMSVKQNDRFEIACYFNKEKYVRKEVADYYYSIVNHVQDGFGLSVYQMSSLADLKAEAETRKLTHIFIAVWEYNMDPEYFEEMANKLYVVIFAESGFVPKKNSNIIVINKPVFIVAVINALNSTIGGNYNKKQEEEITFTNTKALIVDDEPMNLVVAKGILNSYGIKSDTCSSGFSAIEKCMLENYDIIFMDHMMPEMDGIEAMNKIRELRNGYYRKLPIVMLTANAVSGAKEMFLEEGFDDFISKPIEITSMTRVLRNALNKGGAQ